MPSHPELPAAPTSAKDIFGHPRGLATLAGTELWERISFHGMVALLTLYMADQLLLPGHIERIVGFAAYRHFLERITGPLTVEALATQTFGIYIGLIYFTPVLGGLIGDRLLGRRNAVILGCVLMTLGHFSMAFDQSFLLALLLLILGAGFLRGNLIAQVGGLYRDGDARSTHAMQIYYSMVNLGGFVAPLITGALGQRYGWHYGFGFAGIGMLVGLVIYVVGAPYLPQGAPRRVIVQERSLNRTERHTVAALLLLMPLLTLYWVVNSQEWNTYNIWARDHVDGVARLNSTVNGSVCSPCACDIQNCRLSFQLNRTNTSGAGGVGAQYRFDKWAVRAEYERFNAAGGNPSLWSAGITWTFL
jgi:POT family proton-dependent oligopeptide transporter